MHRYSNPPFADVNTVLQFLGDVRQSLGCEIVTGCYFLGSYVHHTVVSFSCNFGAFPVFKIKIYMFPEGSMYGLTVRHTLATGLQCGTSVLTFRRLTSTIVDVLHR